MLFTPTEIDGVTIVELEPRGDDRGFFARFYCREELLGAGLDPVDEQGNLSYSTQAGTLRGLHWQEAPAAEAKLVRCIAGSIFDVAVDIRPDSPTYRNHVGVELSAANRLALYVPKGAAHGYQTLEADTEVLYLTSTPYTPDAERGMRYDDPALGITWPHEVTELSDKDANWELLS
ncbi:MAG: dTDP-4-dehydrorhamnose 3,5-epimerase [Acidimicrobiales bacterium]|nr:dTDP-4-dehydrorhamnose 3,5-epimerase [Acidimicrobiales bacterium]